MGAPKLILWVLAALAARRRRLEASAEIQRSAEQVLLFILHMAAAVDQMEAILPPAAVAGQVLPGLAATGLQMLRGPLA